MIFDATKLETLSDNMRAALAAGPTSSEWKDVVRGVPAEELRAAALAMKDAATEPPRRRMESMLVVREPLFHHGDLVVDGNLRIIAPFFVTGNVTVSGVLKDVGPDSKVGIAGNVRAAHLHTSGEFGCGDIDCPDGVVYGHYNDNSLSAGAIRARVVIADEHDIQAERVVAPTYFDIDKYQQGLPENVRRKLRGIFVDGVFDEEGGLDHDRLFSELIAGNRVFHVATSTTAAGDKGARAKTRSANAASTKPATKKTPATKKPAANKKKPAPKKKAVAKKTPGTKKKPKKPSAKRSR
ncbi:MAG TPA: polymer-forming cytoskeletal protein [Kofleriaceae bacterium]|jgi:hypothetical protein